VNEHGSLIIVGRGHVSHALEARESGRPGQRTVTKAGPTKRGLEGNRKFRQNSRSSELKM
jgi:hypothetical protein